MNETSAPASDPGDNEVDVLLTYDKILTEHGTFSPQAQEFVEKFRDHPELQDKLGATLDFRRLREARQETLANEAARKQQQAQRRVRLIAAIGFVVAIGCIASIWLYAFRADSVFHATKDNLNKATNSLAEKMEKLGETAETLRATDRSAQQLREHVNDLAPALIVGLQADKDNVRERTLSFLYSNGEQLDPLLLKQIGPTLVNILDEQRDKATRVTFFAKGALERMCAAAAKAGATDAIETLEVKLRKSTSQVNQDLLQTVQEIQRIWSDKTPTSIEVNGDECRLDGKLTVKDTFDRVRAGSYCKVYLVRLHANKVYQIDMMAKDFTLDPYLRLENHVFRELAFDDDSGDALNARLLFRPTSDAVYRIIATTFFAKQTGPFELAVQPIDQKGTVLKQSGELTAEDRTGEVRKGVTAHRKVYPVPMKVGREYLVEMDSPDFDAYLRVHDAQGNLVAFDDDSGRGRNAMIRFTPPASATYDIVVTSFLPATGHFSVSVQELRIRGDRKDR